MSCQLKLLCIITTSANLEVVVLSLLFCLQVESSQTSEVLLADSLVDGSSTPNSLSVVVCRVCPPISFRLHVAQDHVLNRCRQARNLPRNVCLPAAPSLTEVLKDRPCFVLLDAFGHHVQDVMHHLCTCMPASVNAYIVVMLTA